ncbi:NCF1 [Branchiostoma lanceolatum]|uniref:NCF1 protein n=1 Tax=Branchiostoma lanceolatum TaxID=7740 RepID=A0A8J9YL88_BRALA|nr:NCF1 [Branchiostoma lanceolatum]
MAEGNRRRSRKSITGVSLLGIEKRYVPNKHYSYILSVKWSEGSEFIIYRRYSAFFQLHQKLSELFPIETGAVSKKDQTIPPLPKQRWFGNEKFKVADERMLTIGEYCRKVAMAEPKISEHEEVLSFFETLPEDLAPPPPDPKKPNKTYLTFQSKSGEPQVKGESVEKSGDDLQISAPILLETYRAIATFSPSGKTEVRLEEGAHVDVVEKNMSGWWLVQVDEKQGWCPASYLEPLDQPEERDEERPNWEGEEFLTTKQYEAQIDDEIGFDKGVIVHVIHKLLDGWWIVRYNDKVGYAPCAYLEKYTNPHLTLNKARARIGSDTTTGSFIKKLPPRRSTIQKKSSAHEKEPKQRDLQIYRRKTLEASKRANLAAKAKEAYRRVSAVTEEPDEEGRYLDMAGDTVASTAAEGYILPDNAVKKFDHPYVNESVVEEIAGRKAKSSDPRSTGKNPATESSHVYFNDEKVLTHAQGTASSGNIYVNEESLTQDQGGKAGESSADGVWAPAFVSSKSQAAYMEMAGDTVVNTAAEGYILSDNAVMKSDHPYVNESVVEEIAGRKAKSSDPRSTGKGMVTESCHIYINDEEVLAHAQGTVSSAGNIYVNGESQGGKASDSSADDIWAPAFVSSESKAAETRNSNSSNRAVWEPAFVDEEKSKKDFPKNPGYIDSNTVASMTGKRTRKNTQFMNLGYAPDAPVHSDARNPKGPNYDSNASMDSAYENIHVHQTTVAKGMATRPQHGPSPRAPRTPVPAPRSTTPILLQLPGTGRGTESLSGSSTPKSGRSTPRSGRSSPRNGRLSPGIPARPTAAEITAKCSSQTKLQFLQPQQDPEDFVSSDSNGRLTLRSGHGTPHSGRSTPNARVTSPSRGPTGLFEKTKNKSGKSRMYLTYGKE